jgi:hypothetical protein
MIRGIATKESLLYETMWLSLVITLTNLDDLRKIRGIRTQKKRRSASSLAFQGHEKLLTAISSRTIA